MNCFVTKLRTIHYKVFCVMILLQRTRNFMFCMDVKRSLDGKTKIINSPIRNGPANIFGTPTSDAEAAGSSAGVLVN